jgi:hypothetical protein
LSGLVPRLAEPFRGHQKLQLALQLHILNKEVLGYDEPANLRLEVDPSVFFGDLGLSFSSSAKRRWVMLDLSTFR